MVVDLHTCITVFMKSHPSTLTSCMCSDNGHVIEQFTVYDEQLIKERTGHRSDAVRAYKRIRQESNRSRGVFRHGREAWARGPRAPPSAIVL